MLKKFCSLFQFYNFVNIINLKIKDMERIEKKGRARLINYIIKNGEPVTSMTDALNIAYMTLRELEDSVKQIKQFAKPVEKRESNYPITFLE